MRPDMHNVIADCTRFGSSNPSRKWGCRVTEDYDGPNRAPVSRRRQYRYTYKEQADRIGPLYRYLESQVGKPWSRVHADMKKTTPKGLHSTHLWYHINTLVVQNCHVGDDGHVYENIHRMYASGSQKRVDQTHSGGRYGSLYVHPISGLLCRARYVAKPSEIKPTTLIPKSPTDYYELMGGIWYHLQIESWEEKRPFKTDDWGNVLEWRTHTQTRTHKRQINRHELRKLGVKNAA